MSTPIVNPWFFYFMEFSNKLSTVFYVVIVVGIIASVVSGIIHIIAVSDEDTFDDSERVGHNSSSILKKSVIATLIATMLYVVCPSKETLIAMAVAQNVTPQNVEMTVEGMKSAVDYIFDKVKEVKSESKEKK